MVEVPRGHAIVIGGSIAGLLAARVLADAYTKVSIVDRDELSENPQPRGGVPQGRHAHGLLAGGRQVLEELFPGLVPELVEAGVPTGDQLGETRFYVGGHLLKRSDSGLLAVSASRPMLEARIRARVRALPNVTLVERADVVGLSADAGRTVVTGVRLVPRGGDRAVQVLDADLVVDASGRGSRAPAWLAELGYQPPTEDTVQIDLGYATQTFGLDRGALGGDIAVIIGVTPDQPRGGVCQILEGGRIQLSLLGILGDYPPSDDEGFRKFAASLAQPIFDNVLRDRKPDGRPASLRFSASVRRRYERLDPFPAGLLVMGDALCSFNPTYAQGMSVAALQSLTLRDEFRSSDAPDAGRLFRALAKVVDGPWQMAAGGDLVFPEVPGKRSVPTRLINAYIAQVLAAAEDDTEIANAFIRVASMVDAAPSLMRPDRVGQVLIHRLRRSRRPARQPVAASDQS
jgi:2-polyprenyl-6-methoxyphenol hydroxylase-like FAD-dependent oxidoreductase